MPTAPLLALGAVLVALGLWSSFGTFSPAGLVVMTAAGAAALAAAWAGRTPRDGAPPAWAASATRALLLAGLGLSLATHLVEIPGRRLAPVHHPYFTSLAWAELALALTYLLPRPPALVVRWRFTALAAGALLLGAVTLATAAPSRIDVFMFQEVGGAELWQGHNPYELVFPNIYRHDRFYGPGVLEGGQVVVYPYPPLVPLLEAPVVRFLGDVRWLLLAAAGLAAALVARLGRRPEAELAGLLVLLQPRGFYALEMSWTEPLVLAAWAATLVALARWGAAPPRGWVGAALAAAALLGMKQYTPLLAWPLLLAAPPARRGWAAGLALLLVALVTAPFVAWNPAEFWRDVVACQVRQPFRLDALSWPAAVARAGGPQLPSVVGLSAAAAVALLAPGRRPSLAHAAACAAAAFLTLLLLAKQAFCNYYWLAAGLLASAAALASPAGAPAPAPREDR